MAIPPKQIKINKDGVTYISGLDRCQYTMHELSRAALRDVGSFILRRAKQKIPKITGTARKNLGAWVRKKQQYPDLQVGYKWYDKKRKKVNPGWYAAYFEVGAANNPKTAPYYSTIAENIDEIRRIEGQYLSAIEDENRALGLIDEEEVFIDENTG